MNREQIEAVCTANRIRELRLNPVHGKFDAAHLKEINRRIFQDLPGLGFPEVTPGQFRPPVPAGLDWIKTRSLESVSATSCVAYSRMDDAAQAQLDRILEQQANPEGLKALKTAEFTRAIGELYAEIDYIHPFRDGNSRTLREFTRQLAEASGYRIDWARFNRQPAGRDILYIARDLDVNKLAVPHIQDLGARRDVMVHARRFQQESEPVRSIARRHPARPGGRV
ncbi:MAG: Fic family protein [Zoogloeaceae bacterium]|jgi:cell filamentation protein|nr:Fic family protein [Zoogloeaceae bacterium]